LTRERRPDLWQRYHAGEAATGEKEEVER
jgi:hypothetical protein